MPKIKMKRLFYFFIDGLGLAESGPHNPMSDLFAESLGGERLVKTETAVDIPGGVLVPIDAVQGVKGNPQSATGQTSLYSGVNAQKVVGYHLTAFPNPRLMRLLRERSLLKKLHRGGISVTSANLYSKDFFLKRSRRRKNMLPASTLSIKAADIPFRMKDEYLQGRALFADITNRFARDKGMDIDLITPESGAERIHNIMDEARAVFFEYFMTDVHGHKRNKEALIQCKEELSRFLTAVLKDLDDETSVLIVSDHGNSEDIAVGNHTKNLIPLIVFSKDESFLKGARECRRLSDTYYLVMDYFAVDHTRLRGRLG